MAMEKLSKNGWHDVLSHNNINSNLDNIQKNSVEFKKITKFYKSNRKHKIKKENLDQYSKNSLISYLKTNNKLKIGCILINQTNDYFMCKSIYTNKKYKVYFNFVQKIWIKDEYLIYDALVEEIMDKTYVKHDAWCKCLL